MDTQEDYFLDVSEQLRSIVRNEWYKSLNPELMEVKRVRQDIKQELIKKSEKEIMKKMLDELDSIKKQIKYLVMTETRGYITNILYFKQKYTYK